MAFCFFASTVFGEKMEYMHEYARPFYFEGGEHAVLLTHGFTGSPATVRYLGERLHEAGFTVQGICLPGHGTRLEDMRAVRWQDYVRAELDALHALKERYEKVTVCGLSMGGDLSLIAAEQAQVHSCIAISAPMKTQVRFDWAAGLVSPFVPVTYWRGSSAKRQDDPMQAYKIGYAGFPTRSVSDLRRLMHLARKNLYALTCPLLVVQSHGDHTISADSAQIILAGTQSLEKEMLWLNDAPHACTASKACDEIAARAIDFLKKPRNT